MKTATTLFFVCLSFCGMSQLPGMNTTSRQMVEYHTPTHHERYGVDYELENYTFEDQDSLILNKINLAVIEEHRAANHEVQVQCPDTLIMVTLYARKDVDATYNELGKTQL